MEDCLDMYQKRSWLKDIQCVFVCGGPATDMRLMERTRLGKVRGDLPRKTFLQTFTASAYIVWIVYGKLNLKNHIYNMSYLLLRHLFILGSTFLQSSPRDAPPERCSTHCCAVVLWVQTAPTGNLGTFVYYVCLHSSNDFIDKTRIFKWLVFDVPILRMNINCFCLASVLLASGLRYAFVSWHSWMLAAPGWKSTLRVLLYLLIVLIEQFHQTLEVTWSHLTSSHLKYI